MNVGTLIHCDSKDELIQTLTELEEAGYGAVVWNYYTKTIVIISVPESTE